MLGERHLRVILAALAIFQLALAASMLFFPQRFFDTLGPWGQLNTHYVRDLATVYGAIGLGTLIAMRRTAWRIPVLLIGAIEYGLHAANHVLDIREADPEVVGYVILPLLALTAALLTWLAHQSGGTR
jgi:hypothetical protein